ASTLTDADGYYLFVDVPPGNYRVVETPPDGFTNRSAQGLSQIDPVSVPAGTRNTLLINVLDSAQLSSTFLGLYTDRDIPQTGVPVCGHVPFAFSKGPGPVGQFHLPIDRPGLPPVDIRTFCAELAIATQWPDGGFTPLPIHGILPERGRQIGYLFNHYGVRA